MPCNGQNYQKPFFGNLLLYYRIWLSLSYKFAIPGIEPKPKSRNGQNDFQKMISDNFGYPLQGSACDLLILLFLFCFCFLRFILMVVSPSINWNLLSQELWKKVFGWKLIFYVEYLKKFFIFIFVGWIRNLWEITDLKADPIIEGYSRNLLFVCYPFRII